MLEKTKQTYGWLRDIVLNPDIVWIDPETREEVGHERWTRRRRWHLLRPTWTYYFLTTRSGCGCVKRFGLWHTMWCTSHAGLDELEDD